MSKGVDVATGVNISISLGPRAGGRGFTLIEMMVAIALLLMLGVMIIGFLRGALDVTRTATARGLVVENSQTVMRQISSELAQVLPDPAHSDGPIDDMAFVIMPDPFGRQMIAFTRAWGEEQRTLAGYDAGRGSPRQGYSRDFTGRNVRDRVRPSGGSIEVVYLMEPSPDGVRLYRAERSPPRRGGLIDMMIQWCENHAGSYRDDLIPRAALNETRIEGESLWSQFHMVADNILGLGIECWDDWDNATTSWFAGGSGPVHTWSMGPRRAEGRYVLPRAVRITVLVAAGGAMQAETTLRAPLSSQDTAVLADMTGDFPDVLSGSAYIRVGNEVIAYGSRAGRTFGSAVRGAMGTTPTDHEVGTLIIGGEAFQRIVQIPVTR
jgi:prepilin-type N-terminal cleavage/methylation domain-containing protein